MTHIYGISDNATWLETATKVAQETIAPHALAVDSEGRFPSESLEALKTSGLLGLCVPTEYGGGGQGPAAFAAVVETLSQACGSTAMVYVMHLAATSAIVAAKTLGQRDPLLRQIAAGRHLSTLAFSEKGSRSQFWAPVSTLVENGEQLVCNAFKSWVTSADHATSYVCSSQKPGANSPAESTLYLVPRERDGVRTSGGFDGLGLRGNDSKPVSIEDLHLDADEMLTPHGDGMKTMLEVVLPWFNVGTSAMAHGLCLATVSATAQHLEGTHVSHTHSQLRDLPNLRARLAEMHVRTEQSRALLGHTLRSMANPDPSTPLYVLSARHAALSAAVDVTDLGMKCCGGAAFSKHLPIERLFRDARAGWVMAPTVDHCADFIGRALTNMELFS